MVEQPAKTNPADAPPAIAVHVVAGLGPGFLVEIDAVAAA